RLDLPVDPVAEPQPPLMPPRRLRNPQPAQHNLRFKHDAPLLCSLHERPPARSTAAGTQARSGWATSSCCAFYLVARRNRFGVGVNGIVFAVIVLATSIVLVA